MSKLTVAAIAVLAAAIVLIAVACFDGRTRGWWATRIELALGIAAAVFATWVVLFYTLPGFLDPMFRGRAPLPLGVPPVLIPLCALLAMVAGLAWMIRIFRGPRDEPPSWRYRDR
jgi:hypothetical protein